MSTTLPFGSCFHQSSHVLPHTSFCVFYFVVEPHKAAERLQNHFENSGGQPALTALLASGNFLGDIELVENLEITKRTAAEIEVKVCSWVFSYSNIFPVWFTVINDSCGCCFLYIFILLYMYITILIYYCDIYFELLVMKVMKFSSILTYILTHILTH